MVIALLFLIPGLMFAAGQQAEEEEGSEEAGILGFPRTQTMYADMVTGRVLTPDNFNEWVGWKNRDRGMQQVMNESMWTSDFINGQGIAGLASGPPAYNNDFTQVTFNLRPGVFWSDGVEFTAEDVAFTIKLLRDTPGMNYHSEMQVVEDAYAKDKTTAVVELKEPNSRFHSYFRDFWGCLWIMPKHVFEDVDDPVNFKYNPPLSLGPYVLHSFDPVGMWTAWEKREDWQRTPTGILYGEPAPKYVVFRHIEDPSLRVISMVRHELDSSFMPLESIRATMGASPYARSKMANFPWAQVGAPTVNGHYYNTKQPPFDNKEVRWALTLAIDIVSFLGVTYDGGAGMSALPVSNTLQYLDVYYEPMEEWLEDFTIDIGNGETFKPYDTNAPQRVMDYVKARGYTLPTDPEEIKHVFGVGWWKYAPDVAAKLLEKNGFRRNAEGKWLLPDGTPWKIELLTTPVVGHDMWRSSFALSREWQEFGIDAESVPNENAAVLSANGEFEVYPARPIPEPWGDYPDMFRSFNVLHSDYVEPELGKRTWGWPTRWSDPRMDEVIEELQVTDWTDTDRLIELGMDGMKVLVEEMPCTPLFTLLDLVSWDTYYWENWPGEENPYMVPFHHWPNCKYMLTFLKSTGR